MNVIRLPGNHCFLCQVDTIINMIAFCQNSSYGEPSFLYFHFQTERHT